jgi:hypothetical protein
MMMKSAEDRLSGDLADPLDRPMARRILIQGQMRSEFAVIPGVGGKDLTQMGVAEDDDVIRGIPAGSSRSVSPHVRSARVTARPLDDHGCPWQQDAW